jgi:hypothetical protein
MPRQRPVTRDQRPRPTQAERPDGTEEWVVNRPMPSSIANHPTPPRGAESTSRAKESPAPTAFLARAVFVVAVAVYALARLSKPDWWDLLDDVTLAVHEAGHLVFAPFGETMGILGGSLFQAIVPAAFVVYFFWHRQRYAGAITMSWVG